MIGSFAPQGMNVVVITVIRRSFWFSMVRDAITPGTPQPVPIRIGTKDLPDRPKRRNTRSRMNAIRDIYPQLSRNARSRKRTSICGMKPSTAPTPATMPSRMSAVSQSAASIEASASPMMTGKPGTQMPYSVGSGTSPPEAAMMSFASSYAAASTSTSSFSPVSSS